MPLEISVDREVWPAEFLPATRDEAGRRFTRLSALKFARDWTKANAGRLARVVAFTPDGRDAGFALIRNGELIDKGGRLS